MYREADEILHVSHISYPADFT